MREFVDAFLGCFVRILYNRAVPLDPRSFCQNELSDGGKMVVYRSTHPARPITATDVGQSTCPFRTVVTPFVITGHHKRDISDCNFFQTICVAGDGGGREGPSK